MSGVFVVDERGYLLSVPVAAPEAFSSSPEVPEAVLGEHGTLREEEEELLPWEVDHPAVGVVSTPYPAPSAAAAVAACHARTRRAGAVSSGWTPVVRGEDEEEDTSITRSLAPRVTPPRVLYTLSRERRRCYD